MTIFNPIAESQFLVSFSGYGSFLFSEKNGGDITRDSSDYANGSGNAIYHVVGPQKISNVTLKAPYDPTLMAYLEPIIFAYSCGLENNITITPVSCNGNPTTGTAPAPANAANSFSIAGVTPIPIGTPYVYSGARMTKYVMPKVDRKASTVAMFEIEFVVNEVTRGAAFRGTGTTANPNRSTSLISDFFGSNVG